MAAYLWSHRHGWTACNCPSPEEPGNERDQRGRHGPGGGLQQRGGVLVRERADRGDRPARGPAAPAHRAAGRRVAVAGGRRQPGARPGRGRATPRRVLTRAVSGSSWLLERAELILE